MTGTGTFQHNVDDKGRLFIPAKLREELGDVFFVFTFLDRCLWVYSQESWDKMREKLAGMPSSRSRKMKRIIYPTSQKCEPDNQGRVLISKDLRDYAEIEKESVIIGAGDHVEIWSKQRWDQRQVVSEDDLEQIADELGL
ncbi:MAG: division/cell wall cluster transcriptional repressor MraZ [Oscillospiraceae bacterium]|nr:division/cell wall cluster transcriptional repressor MraZ [Oscillospiraceae bacterium]